MWRRRRTSASATEHRRPTCRVRAVLLHCPRGALPRRSPWRSTMRPVRSRLAAVVLTTMLAPVASAATAPKNVPQYSIEDFLATTTMRGADFSPDRGSILVSSDRTGVFNAYAVPVAGGE